MTFSRPLKDRERALEDAFFREETKRLLEAMRARETREQQFEGLANLHGIHDPAVIEPLLDFGLREENAAALLLIPLIVVAWADHRLDNDERRSIHKAEADHGISPESEAGQLLEIWLEHRPHESLLDAWIGYVHELFKVLPAASRERTREDILSRIRKMVRAFEKSFLRGGGPVDAEKEAIAKIEAALAEASGDGPDPLDEAICSST